LAAAIILFWCFPAVIVEGMAGHIVLTLLYLRKSNSEDNKGHEMVPLLRLPGLGICARNIGEQAEESFTSRFMCALLFALGQFASIYYCGYNLLFSKTENEGSTVGGVTPVTAYINRASMMTPVIKKAPRDVRYVFPAQRYSISSSATTHIKSFTEFRDP
jgi:hypothetical protein